MTPCHVLAVPYPGRGHMTPMLSVCSAIAETSSNILITIIVTEEWLGLIGSAAKPPKIRFATIANVLPSELVRGDDRKGFSIAVRTKMEEPVERLIDRLWLQLELVLIIADAVLRWAAPLAARKNIPVASVWVNSASVYTAFYHFDLIVQNGHFPIDLPVNGDEIVDYIPGLPPLLVADLPKAMRSQEESLLIPLLFPNPKYLIFISIYDLESQVINNLKQKSMFSIYNIGPSTSYFKVKHILDHQKDLLNPIDLENNSSLPKWLDRQPPNSVLYISLGSFISVSDAQMDEIASGLVDSGVRFLWLARAKTTRMKEICGEIGMIVAWCDQLCVLCHPSVAGFLTHCGWNSAKEGALTGVPMLTFPISGDQVCNAKAIVEDWRIGWRLRREYDEYNLAKASEISEIVTRFMDLDSEERKEISKNARELKRICEGEFEDGGSFKTNVESLTRSIMELNSNVI